MVEAVEVKKTMANARMISREFFTSADLEGLGAKGKLLFAGLIVHADDAGIIRHHVGFYRACILHGERTSVAWVLHVLSTLEARHVLSPCNLEGVKCWRITNFSRFQRLKRREGKRRDEEGRVSVDKAQEPPPQTTADPDPRAEVFEFFESELGAKPKHDAWGAIVKLGTTPRDVQEWRKAVLWAREHSRLDDPVGFVLSKALSFRNPTAAGLSLEARRAPGDSAHRSSLNEGGKFDHLA